jgi:hypothetical protein
MEISHDDVPINATLAPIVNVLRRIDNVTQFHEPLRNERRRRRIGDF